MWRAGHSLNRAHHNGCVTRPCMKTPTLAASIAAILAVPCLAIAQQSSNPQQPSSGTSPSASSTTTTTTSTADQGGIIVQNGVTFTVRNGQATRLDTTTLQSGQMMTSDGHMVSIPSNVTGIEGFTPSPTATTDASASVQAGVAVHSGVTYLIRNGQATRIDTTTLPSGQIMTWEGQVTAQPQNIQGLESTSSNSSTQPPSARDLAPGRSTNPPPGQGGIVPGQGKRDSDATNPSDSSTPDRGNRSKD